MKIDFRNNKFRRYIYNYLIDKIIIDEEKLEKIFSLDKKQMNNNDLLKFYFELNNFISQEYLIHMDEAIFNYFIIQKGEFKKFNKILSEEMGGNIFTFKHELWFKLKYYFLPFCFWIFAYKVSLFYEISKHVRLKYCLDSPLSIRIPAMKSFYLAIDRFLEK